MAFVQIEEDVWNELLTRVKQLDAAVKNETPHRGRWQGKPGGGTAFRDAIITCDYDDGVYGIEFGLCDVSEPSGDCPDTESLIDPCEDWDLCDGTPECEDIERPIATATTGTGFAIDIEPRRIVVGATVGVAFVGGTIPWRIVTVGGSLQCYDHICDVECGTDCEGDPIIIKDRKRFYYPPTFWLCDCCDGSPECSGSIEI